MSFSRSSSSSMKPPILSRRRIIMHGSAAALLFLCTCPVSLSYSTAPRGKQTARPCRNQNIELRGGRPHSETETASSCTCFGTLQSIVERTASRGSASNCSAFAGSGGGCGRCLPAKLSGEAGNTPQHDLLWKQDVGERYKMLVPPRQHISFGLAKSLSWGPLISETQMRDAVAKATASTQLPGVGGKCIDEITMFVDLDKAAIFGNDGNDFGIALQWMDRPYSDVVKLYKHLLNPNLKETYRALSARAHKVHVVIYTMRSTYLVYQSCFREYNAQVPLRWNASWHVDGQLYLPSHLKNSHDIMAQTDWSRRLLESERLDMKKSLERLLAVREVIQGELKLEELPQVVVTAQQKSVPNTARDLGYDVDKCYLWDDNLKIASNPHVVHVAPFVAMTPSRREALLKFLDRTLSPAEMEEDLTDFLLSAPPSEAALVRDSTGELTYHVSCVTQLQPWSLPRTGVWARQVTADNTARASAREEAMEKMQSGGYTKSDARDFELGGQMAQGLGSPVTPFDTETDLVLSEAAATLGAAMGCSGSVSRKGRSLPRSTAGAHGPLLRHDSTASGRGDAICVGGEAARTREPRRSHLTKAPPRTQDMEVCSGARAGMEQSLSGVSVACRQVASTRARGGMVPSFSAPNLLAGSPATARGARLAGLAGVAAAGGGGATERPHAALTTCRYSN